MPMQPPELPPPDVVTIGDERRAEFAGLLAWLRRRARVVCCRVCSQLAEVIRAETPRPVLIVWLQSLAGEFCQMDCAALAGQFPGVNMVCAYAACAEGETRTGKPLRGVQRFPALGWASRLEPLWRIAGRRRNAGFPSATIAVRGGTSRDDCRGHSLVVGVYSAAPEMQVVLCDALRALNFNAQPVECSPHSSGNRFDSFAQDAVAAAGFNAAIWDDSPHPRRVKLNLMQFAAAVAPRPVLAIVGFPRWQDAEQFAYASVRHVLGKPLNLAELAHCLQAVAAEFSDSA
jgi:hypothetical protein